MKAGNSRGLLPLLSALDQGLGKLVVRLQVESLN